MSEIKITVQGPVGSGKSALLGEIEILCKALGVPVRYADPSDAASEKSMTHADWTAYLEMYKPSVVLHEKGPDRAALASTPVADVPLTHRCANCGAVFQGAGCPSCRLAAPVASAPVAEPGTMEEIHRQERERSPWVLPKDPTLPDSAPVAGEAKNYPGENVAERLDNMADDQPPGSQAQSDLYAAATIWRKHIAHRAAPQASEAHGVDHFRDATQMVGASEAVRDAALEEAAAVAKRISDKYAFGLSSIESSTADEIEREILALKTQADKDGGQLRAGDVSAEAHRAALLEVERVGIELAGRLHEAAMSLETISQIAGRPGKDMETMDDVRGYAHSRARAARAAPSAPQAEQGEREDG